MSKKLGFVSRVFPRFSKKMKRLYNEAGYRTRRNDTPYSRSGFLASDLFMSDLINNNIRDTRRRDAVKIILFVTRDNPLKAENMIEERLASEMFSDISSKNRSFFFDTMNSFEELEYTYKKLYQQQQNIQKIWENAYRIFNENFKLRTSNNANKNRAINYYIKFLKTYLKRYLRRVTVRSLKVERHVQRVIEKIIFLRFLKHYKKSFTFDTKEDFFSYFYNEKRKLTSEFSISRIHDPISNNSNNNAYLKSSSTRRIVQNSAQVGQQSNKSFGEPFDFNRREGEGDSKKNSEDIKGKRRRSRRKRK